MAFRFFNKHSDKWTSAKENRLFSFFLTYALPLIGIAASAWGTDIYRAEDQFKGLVIILAAGAITLLGQWWRQKKTREREERRNKHLTRFNDKFKSIIDPLSNLFESPKASKDATQFLQWVLNSSSNLFVQDDLRLTIYQLEKREEDEAETVSGDTHCYLQLVETGGRGDHPRKLFDPNTTWGQHAIAVAQGNVAVPITYVDPKDERFNRRESSTWQSFMAFPIRYNHQNIGVLMVDSRAKTRWTYEDQAVGSTISLIVAFGLQILRSGSADPTPELEGWNMSELKRSQNVVPYNEGTANAPEIESTGGESHGLDH